jgi:hypothetical protein
MFSSALNPLHVAAPVSHRARTRVPAAGFFNLLKLHWLLPAAVTATIMSATFSVALAQGTWSTSRLSVARFGLAAASSGKFAVFAGGTTPQDSLLMSSAVDLYNSETGTWSTASLSVARAYLAAASGGNLAIFAGGLIAAGVSWILEWHDRQLHIFCFLSNVDSCVYRDINLLLHLIARFLTRSLAAVGSSAVDIFDVLTGSWSTAQLNVPRFHLAAASVGNFAIFAGGQDKNFGIFIVLF